MPTLYVICHAGGRSLRVANYLARNGYDPDQRDEGGMLAWARSRSTGHHRRRWPGQRLSAGTGREIG